MKLVALYKTFRGDEFIEASIESIYDHVDHIVFVHSNTSWNGQTGNTIKPIVDGWVELYDYKDKIIQIDHDCTMQDEQYRVGFNHIKNHLDDCWVLLIDADEVWDDGDMEAAMDILPELSPETMSCRCNLHTYIKNIFYRIHPTYGQPVTFVRSTWPGEIGTRGLDVRPSMVMKNVFFHHFTYVRRSLGIVKEKLLTSAKGDGGERLVDWDRWIREKWNKLPHDATDLHAFRLREKLWGSIKPIWLDDLPASVRNKPIVDMFLPRGALLAEEESRLFEISQGRNLAVDLGTFFGRSAIILSLGARHVLTIDAFEDITHDKKQGFDLSYKEFFDENKHYFERVIRQLRNYSNIEIIRGWTWENTRPQVDVLFIDADHSYEGVKRDYEAWLPFVRRGSLIVFHDYSHPHRGVIRFIDELQETTDDVLPIRSLDTGSLRVFRKAANV